MAGLPLVFAKAEAKAKNDGVAWLQLGFKVYGPVLESSISGIWGSLKLQLGLYKTLNPKTLNPKL